MINITVVNQKIAIAGETRGAGASIEINVAAPWKVEAAVVGIPILPAANQTGVDISGDPGNTLGRRTDGLYAAPPQWATTDWI